MASRRIKSLLVLCLSLFTLAYSGNAFANEKVVHADTNATAHDTSHQTADTNSVAAHEASPAGHEAKEFNVKIKQVTEKPMLEYPSAKPKF